jgi:hypothetical protein
MPAKPILPAQATPTPADSTDFRQNPKRLACSKQPYLDRCTAACR